MLGDDHRLGLELLLGREAELGGALGRDHRGALGAHLPELLEPALVALAPRGDAAFEPVRLDLQPRVELFRCARFLGIDLLFPCLVAAEADFLASQRPAVEPDRRARQALEEGAVVADDDERALVTVEPAFEPVDRREIEMVGRLVHQQQVGLLRQRLRDRRTAPFAAARALGRGRHVDAELARDGFDFMLGRRVRTAQGEVHQRIAAREIGLLLQQHDPGAGLDLARAAIGLDPVVDQAEQRGLARAVAADQREPVARADMQVDVALLGPAEQPAAALLQPETFPGEDRWLCHEAREVGEGGLRCK